jgi:hypothetical protein
LLTLAGDTQAETRSPREIEKPGIDKIAQLTAKEHSDVGWSALGGHVGSSLLLFFSFLCNDSLKEFRPTSMSGHAGHSYPVTSGHICSDPSVEALSTGQM